MKEILWILCPSQLRSETFIFISVCSKWKAIFSETWKTILKNNPYYQRKLRLQKLNNSNEGVTIVYDDAYINFCCLGLKYGTTEYLYYLIIDLKVKPILPLFSYFVGAHYTNDEWNSVKHGKAKFIQNTIYGESWWRLYIGIRNYSGYGTPHDEDEPFGQKIIKFAVYLQDNQTNEQVWDNNGGENYSILLDKTLVKNDEDFCSDLPDKHPFKLPHGFFF